MRPSFSSSKSLAAFAALAFIPLASNVFAQQGPSLGREPDGTPTSERAVDAPVGARVDSQERLKARARRLERLKAESPDASDEFRATEKLSRAVNGELKDVARALRSLDQSFALRGLQSRKAWTASSAYMDWRAQGIDLPRSARVLPPPPRFVGCGPKFGGCAECSIRPLFAAPCDREPCETAPLAVAPALDLSDLFTFRCEKPVVWKLVPHATARVDAEGCLIAGLVNVTAIEGRIVDEARAANSWTMGLDLVVAEEPSGRHVLTSSGEDLDHPQFALVLEGRTLNVTLRTGPSDSPAETTVQLLRLESGVRQVAVRYTPGKLTGWVNGEQVASSNRIVGDLSCWKSSPVTIGHREFDAERSARIRTVVLSAQSE